MANETPSTGNRPVILVGGVLVLVGLAYVGMWLGRFLGNDIVYPDSFLHGIATAAAAIGAMGLTVPLLVAFVVARRRSQRATRLVVVWLITLWASLIFSTVQVAMAGAPRPWQGTVRLDLGPPVNASQSYPATCTPPLGSQTAVESISSSGTNSFFMSPGGFFWGWDVYDIQGMGFRLVRGTYELTPTGVTAYALTGSLSFHAIRDTHWANPQPYHPQEFDFVLHWDCRRAI